MLVFIGIGIALVAGAFALLAGFFTLESRSAEVVVEETVEIIVTREAPAISPSAEPTVAPSAIPPVDDTPKPATPVAETLSEEGSYLQLASDSTEVLLVSMDRYFDLMASPSYGEGEWKERIAQEFALWESIETDVASLDAPSGHEASHAALLNAVDELAEAARKLRAGILEDNVSGLADGFEHLTEGVIQLHDAEDLRHQEAGN